MSSEEKIVSSEEKIVSSEALLCISALQTPDLCGIPKGTHVPTYNIKEYLALGSCVHTARWGCDRYQIPLNKR